MQAEHDPNGHNRVFALMLHTSRYSERGAARLARDAGIGRTTLWRMVHGLEGPYVATALKVLQCLEYNLGRKLHFKEVFSADGKYPTKHICRLAGCRGCLPSQAFANDGSRVDSWKDVKPGRWTGDLSEFDKTE
jgi:DNA-binding phage protein